MNVTLNIPYSKHHQPKRRLDLFLPEDNGNGRAILFIHGGGWRGGSKEQWHSTALYFCNMGYACASAGYRLAPGGRFQDQVEDVRLAMSFFKAHADEYGFSPDKVASLGSSAGGHLVAILATLDTDDDLGMSDEITVAETRPNAALCYCAVLNLHESSRGGAIPDAVLDLMGKREAEDPALYEQASPIDRVSDRTCPTLFIHGDADATVPLSFSTDMAEKLTAAGVRADVVVLPGEGHGFGYGVLKDTQKISVKHVEAFLDEVLG